MGDSQVVPQEYPAEGGSPRSRSQEKARTENQPASLSSIENSRGIGGRRRTTAEVHSQVETIRKFFGRYFMAATHGVNKKKLVGKTLFLGAITAVLYAAVFTNADLIMSVFTRGGFYAALPIVTVFAFSFAHGSFAGNLWSLLGIEAVTKQPATRPEVRPAPRPAQRPRPRLRMTA
jgi:hypothetical protein